MPGEGPDPALRHGQRGGNGSQAAPWQQTHSDARFTLGQKSEIESLAVSADGNWAAIGLVHKDGLFVWDLKTRQDVAQLAPGEGNVRVAFSPAESLMAFSTLSEPAIGKGQATLRFWNAAPRQMAAEFPLEGECEGLAFSRDGRTLVTSVGGGHLTLWRVPDGSKLARSLLRLGLFARQPLSLYAGF